MEENNGIIVSGENDIDIKSVWNDCLPLIGKNTTAISYDVWIKSLLPLELKNNTLVLGTPSSSSKNVILKHYKDIIKNALSQVHTAITDIEVVVSTGEESEEKSEENNVAEKKEEPRVIKTSSVFNPKYTFDNFVVGGSNQFVAAAAKAVAEAPGKKFNPLFIYGGSGLGKTHLLQAIGNYVTEHNKDMKVIYTPTSTFSNELISAIRSNSKSATSEFRELYRTADVLIVDDIQYLVGKTSTQEEFFQTFNELYERGKQIVLAADKPPKEIATLEERIRSRMEWGMIADIGVPDVETRIAILYKKAQIERYNISREAIEYIADISTTNIREMEGYLSRVVFFAGLIGENPASIQSAREALKNIAIEKTETVDADNCIDCVCKFYSIKKEDLLAKKRTKEIAQARQVAMFLISELVNLPLVTIGNIFGKDHATVIYAKSKIGEDMKKSKKLAVEINDMKQMIKGK